MMEFTGVGWKYLRPEQLPISYLLVVPYPPKSYLMQYKKRAASISYRFFFLYDVVLFFFLFFFLAESSSRRTIPLVLVARAV